MSDVHKKGNGQPDNEKLIEMLENHAAAWSAETYLRADTRGRSPKENCVSWVAAQRIRELSNSISEGRDSPPWRAIAKGEPYGMDFPIFMSAPGWRAAESVQFEDDYRWQRDHEGATHWMPQPGAPK